MIDSMSLPPRDTIKDMKGGDLFALITDTVENEASYIRTLQEIYVHLGQAWMPRAARKHHCFVAIQETFELLLKEIDAAKAKGQAVDPLIGRIAATIKKALLREMDALGGTDAAS